MSYTNDNFAMDDLSERKAFFNWWSYIYNLNVECNRLFNSCHKKDLEKSDINKTRAIILKNITYKETPDMKRELYELGILECEDLSKGNKNSTSKKT